ncbi:MAG: type II secretion system protein [Phycisphaerae bacterium]
MRVINNRELSPAIKGLKCLLGFTLIELLVVISIIALLISMLLPALAQARSLALQIECASNMQQIGIAMSEYASEYKGMYPLTYTANWPFGTFAASNSYEYPSWGLGLLYYDSFGVVGNTMINPRPGILKPNVRGISMMYSTQPGLFTEAEFFPPSVYTGGIVTNWSYSYSGYSYWLDRDKYKYSPGEDLAGSQTYVDTFTYLPDYYKYRTAHIPAMNPRSNPGSILLTDNVLFEGVGGLRGLAGWPTNNSNTTAGNGSSGAGTPASNHVLTNDNFLPAGAHELYNDGAVVWQPMSQITPRRIREYGLIAGW